MRLYRAAPFSRPTAPSYDPYPYPPPAGAYHKWDLDLASFRDTPAVSSESHMYAIHTPTFWHYPIPLHGSSAAPGLSTRGPILPHPLGNITMSSSVTVLQRSGARATAAPNRKRHAPAASASNAGSKRRNISAPNSRTCDENRVPAAAVLSVPAIPGAGPHIIPGKAAGASVQAVYLNLLIIYCLCVKNASLEVLNTYMSILMVLLIDLIVTAYYGIRYYGGMMKSSEGGVKVTGS